jgi:hypothetical protein
VWDYLRLEDDYIGLPLVSPIACNKWQPTPLRVRRHLGLHTVPRLTAHFAGLYSAEFPIYSIVRDSDVLTTDGQMTLDKAILGKKSVLFWFSNSGLRTLLIEESGYISDPCACVELITDAPLFLGPQGIVMCSGEDRGVPMTPLV